MTTLTKYGRPRDSQRQKVYDAERAAFGNHHRHSPGNWVTHDETVAYIKRTMATKWWRDRYPDITPETLAVGKTHHGAHCAEGGYRIVLSRWAYRESVVLHELAHVIVERTYAVGRRDEVTWHGWEFAKTYLDLVRRFIGPGTHDRLRDEFRARKVRYKAPRRSTMTDEQRRAAGARLSAARAAKREDSSGQHDTSRSDAHDARALGDQVSVSSGVA